MVYCLTTVGLKLKPSSNSSICSGFVLQFYLRVSFSFFFFVMFFCLFFMQNKFLQQVLQFLEQNSSFFPILKTVPKIIFQ